MVVEGGGWILPIAQPATAPSHTSCSPPLPLHPPFCLQINLATGEVCSLDIEAMFGPTKYMTDIALMLRNILAQPSMTATNADLVAEMMDAARLPGFEEKARKQCSTCKPSA